jgi:hypothetical protein
MRNRLLLQRALNRGSPLSRRAGKPTGGRPRRVLGTPRRVRTASPPASEAAGDVVANGLPTEWGDRFASRGRSWPDRRPVCRIERTSAPTAPVGCCRSRGRKCAGQLGFGRAWTRHRASASALPQGECVVQREARRQSVVTNWAVAENYGSRRPQGSQRQVLPVGAISHLQPSRTRRSGDLQPELVLSRAVKPWRGRVLGPGHVTARRPVSVKRHRSPIASHEVV